jgi:flagellum-specific peptidoglycan hydrolase FlgJ
MPNQINDIASAENQIQNIFGGGNNAGVNNITSAEQQVQSIFGGNSPETQTTNPPSTSNSSWDDFKQTASKIASDENYPINVLLAQAALETAHGTSSFAKNRNNYFGMKAYDSNPDNATDYNTPEESIKDYINLIKNTPRYAGYYQEYLKDHDSLKLLRGIKAAGYATDPNYVNKITSLPEFGGTQ